MRALISHVEPARVGHGHGHRLVRADAALHRLELRATRRRHLAVSTRLADKALAQEAPQRALDAIEAAIRARRAHDRAARRDALPCRLTTLLFLQRTGPLTQGHDARRARVL